MPQLLGSCHACNVSSCIFTACLFSNGVGRGWGGVGWMLRCKMWNMLGKFAKNYDEIKNAPGKQWETYCMKSKYLAEIYMKKQNDAHTSRGSHSCQSQIGFRCCKRLQIPRYVVKAWKREMSFRRRHHWPCSLVNLVQYCLWFHIWIAMVYFARYVWHFHKTKSVSFRSGVSCPVFHRNVDWFQFEV